MQYDLRGKCSRVALGKKLSVNIGEFYFGQFASWAILNKTMIPMLNLIRGEFSFLRKFFFTL